MGLSSALASAVAGLRANQAALSITSSNVANANTPGYIAQSVNQVEVASGGSGASDRFFGFLSGKIIQLVVVEAVEM